LSSTLNQTPAVSSPASVTLGLEDAAPVLRMKTTGELIEFWKGRFERDPRDFISLTYLGEAYIRQGRETGDVSAYERAEATLRRSLEINSRYEPTLAYLSAAVFVKHDFQGALELASRVYAADPRALQALATMGDAQKGIVLRFLPGPGVPAKATKPGARCGNRWQRRRRRHRPHRHPTGTPTTRRRGTTRSSS